MDVQAIGLEWRKSPYGGLAQDLFLGGIYVGSVNGQLDTAKFRPGQWRAWVMDDPDGSEHGWFVDRTEAMAKVETVVRILLSSSKGKGL